MSTRTMTMFMNDFGINQGRASPMLRVTKPASHVFETLMALTDSMVDGIVKGVASVAGWHRRQRAYAELARMDDHLLRDIGIGRYGPHGDR
ncbi:MAG: DUF1127 domain-containing protein [Alphaproteobacteria bacterium]